jgi:ligand-binding sensor domain-containing protein
VAHKSSTGLLWVLLVPGIVLGQRYSFKHYGQDSGLASLEVQSLLQDRSGLLWLGTQNGLYRYNGRHFQPFTTADGLPSMQIWTLAESADGTLWVGGVRGIARRSGDRFLKVDLSPAQGTRSMAADSRNHLFIGTDRGLMVGRLDNSAPAHVQFQLYPNPQPERGAVAYGVALDPDGRVWYGCGRSICVFDGQRVTSRDEWGVPPDEYTGMAVDHGGNVWARSSTRLIELPAGSRRSLQGRNLPMASRVGQLYLDRSGDLFVPTSQGFGHRRPDGSWEMIRKENGLQGETVSCAL